MEHNIHREQTPLSATVSTLLPSTTHAASTSANQQAFKIPLSSLGDHLVSSCLASGAQEFAVLKPVHSRIRESTVSSEYHDTAPESSCEVASSLLIIALDAPTSVTNNNHLSGIDAGINPILDVNQTISHRDEATSATGNSRLDVQNIQKDQRSESQPTPILPTRRPASSHQANSLPTATRRFNTVDDQSLPENTFPPLHPPPTHSTVQFHQEASTSASSLKGHRKYGSRNIQDEIAPRFSSKGALNQVNSSSKKSDPFEARSLRKPALRSTPHLLDPNIKTRDFFHEPVLSPIYDGELVSFNNEDQEPQAASPPEAILRRPSLRSLTFHSSLSIPKKLRTYRSSSLSSASSASTTRLPRYLGNHPYGVSQLGRSISLELPSLNAHYVPRRAHSLPRIAEYGRLQPRPDPEALYISSRVRDFHLEAPYAHLKVRRRLDSSGRTPKTPEYTPSEPRFRYLDDSGAGSSVMVQRDSEETEPGRMMACLCEPSDIEHGLWCRLKKKVGRFLDRLA